MDDLPAADMAELCHEHQDCIKGFKATATGDLAPLAGWWHFVWDQENMQWNITDPTGENGYVVVQSVDASFPELRGDEVDRFLAEATDTGSVLVR